MVAACWQTCSPGYLLRVRLLAFDCELRRLPRPLVEALWEALEALEKSSSSIPLHLARTTRPALPPPLYQSLEGGRFFGAYRVRTTSRKPCHQVTCRADTTVAPVSRVP